MARKRSRDYWKNRALEVERQVFRKSFDFTQETLQNYEKALFKLEKDMNYWLVRLAENNNISLEEARKLLTAKELKEFKWTVEEYIKAGEENAINSRWMKELENASARVHISRLDAMRLQLRQQVELLTGKQNKALGEHLKDIYSDTLNRSLFEIQKGRGIGSTFAKFSQSELDQVTKKPWTLDKSTFSDRIWHHKEKLIDKLNTTLTRSIATGEDPSVAIEEIAKTFNRSRYEASRLVMTESAAFAAQADFDSYIKLGVKKYEIIATLDLKTSDICKSMDGKIFDVKDFQIGVTANPFHPHCRTTTAAYDEELEEFFGPGERAARDPRTGKTVMIPGDMTYAEWKEREGKIEISKSIETRNPADGTGAGVYTKTAKLSTKQQNLLKILPESGTSVIIRKRDINVKDIVALTAETGDEIALFTKKGQRFVQRGSSNNALLNEGELLKLAADGWKFSAHTHPGVGKATRIPSQGDRNVVKLFKQKRSVIYDSVGGFDVYEGD